MAVECAPAAADAWLDALSGGLAADGFAVVDASPLAALRPALSAEAQRLERTGRFRHAGVGRGASFQVRPEIRNDQVCWWDAAGPGRAGRRYLAHMEQLREHLNRTLWLGLARFECHFAVYPAGARYHTHLDRFATAAQRTVSLVCYLNEDWQPADGGVLRLYLGAPDAPPWHDVAPRPGRLVAFESGRFPHEVLPAFRLRRSVAGWFCRHA